MNKQHTVREWLKQLPEPYRTQAFTNTPPHRLENTEEDLYGALLGAFTWGDTVEGHNYWSDLANGNPEQPATKSSLADLLDPSEGWNQKGFVWANEHGDLIRPCRNLDRPGWMDVYIVQDMSAAIGDIHTAPTVLSAMAMVNQYRREWQ